MLHVLPLLLLVQVIVLVVRLLAGGALPGWAFFIECFVATALWPLVAFFYLAPQRRATDRDENRPL
jgi:rod shape-determining protein MreD